MKFWSASLFQYLIEKNLLSDIYVKDGIVKAFIERNSWVNFKISLFRKKNGNFIVLFIDRIS